MSHPEVLVVGGGISGLTLAYDLVRRGVDVALVEEEERLGGLISTTTRDGYLMDAGPDAFLQAKPDGRRLAEELGLGGELIETNRELRRVYVLRGGRLHALPRGMRLTVPLSLRALFASPMFSLPGKLRMALEPLVLPKRDEGEESIASFVRRRFGREALARVGEPLLAGIHCGDARKLSMSALFPRFIELEKRFGSVTRGMKAGEGPGGESVFLSLAGGMGRLVQRLGEELSRARIHFGHRVTEIRRTPSGFVAKLSSGESLAARVVILALPIRASESLLAPHLPDAAQTLKRIPTVSTAVVFHAFRREDVSHPLDGYGFVVPESEPNRLLAATFVSTKFPGRAPPSEVLIRTFLGGLRDGGVVAASDPELSALSLEELKRALGPVGPPLFSRVARWRDRTPQVELGHSALVRTFEREVSTVPGLHVLGSGLRGVGIPDSIAAARELAARVLAFLQHGRSLNGAVR